MGCSNENIPEYLHCIPGKRLYFNQDFKSYHLLFRLGFKESENPIEFPFTSTSISVCWSRLIRNSDVVKVVPEKLGNNLYFARVRELKSYIQLQDCEEGDFKGIHEVSTFIIHSPTEYNYSHSEVLIKHK